jgi:membrane fusion protein (multidrug efflux system)
MKRWPIVFVLVCVLGVGALGTWKYMQIQRAIAQGGPPNEPMEAVITTPVREEAWQPTEGAVGTITPVRMVELRPEIAGTITHVMFESGSRVEAGQELVKFDTRVEEANLRAAVARVNLAKASLERQERAVAMRATSEEERDIARAELERAEAEVALIQAQIAKKTLAAPFAAVLGLRQVHPGQYVDAGEPLAMLRSAGEGLYVDFMVPQDLVTQVGIGQIVTLRTTAILQAQAGDQEQADTSTGTGANAGTNVLATIAAQESETDELTRTLRTRALVEPAPSWMRPGMSVTVLFPRGLPTTVRTIPVMSVRRATFGDHVFVLEADTEKPGMFRAKQRFVTLSETIGDRVIVAKGLSAGELIAAEGSFKLREGILVVPGGAGGAGGTETAGGPAGERADGSEALAKDKQ